MKQVLKKSLALSLIAVLLYAPGASAIFGGAPSTSSVIKSVSSWFGIDQQSSKDMTSSMAVLQNKGMAPQVKITFSPADPEPGEDITAMAAAANFNGTPQNFYYTWFINRTYYDTTDQKYKNCDTDVYCENNSGKCGSNEADRMKTCDYDNDGKVTVHDWKIAAVRLQLENSAFDPEETCVENANCNQTDDDGYAASFGGEGNTIGLMEPGKYKYDCFSADSKYNGGGCDSTWYSGVGTNTGRAYQYIHDFGGGEDWELIDEHPDLQDKGADTCGNETVDINGTAYAKVPMCGKGALLDDEDPIVENELVYPTPAPFSMLYIGCENTGESPVCRQDKWQCREGTAVCAYDYSGAEYGDFLWTHIEGSDDRVDAYTGSCKLHFSPPLDLVTADCGEQYSIKHALGFHMFPQPIWYGEDSTKTKPCGDKDAVDDDTTGDGYFDESEECFWGTDPQDPDTLDIGVKDEALVAGQGVQQLTWEYQAGDRIGVIVEGNGLIATKHPDGSQQIHFAMPNNVSGFLTTKSGGADVAATGTVYYDNGSKYGTNINIARGLMSDDEMDDSLGVKGTDGYEQLRPIFNKFLQDNLVDPMTGGQTQKLEVDVSHSPELPMNQAYADIEDGGIDLGDIVTLNANVSGAGMSDKKVEFDWTIKYLATTTKPTRDVFENEDRWEEVEADGFECTSSAIGDCATKFELNRMKGGNLNKLELKLGLEDTDFEEDSAYVYVKAVVRETTGADPNQTGRNYSRGAGSDIFRIINQGGNKIKVSRISKVTDKENLKNGATEEEICGTGSGLVLCTVLKNEIIKVDAAELANYESYSWTINGKPMDCDNGNCGNDDDKVNYFATTGEAGKIYTVKVSAIGGSGNSSQQPKEMQRAFMVVEPKIGIDMAGLTRKTLGEYTDITDGSKITDLSKTVVTAESGTGVTLGLSQAYPYTDPLYLLDMIETDSRKYTVDGVAMDDGETFTVGQNEASGHLIQATADYVIDNSLRQALNSLWNVGQFESSGGRLEAKLVIEIDDGGGAAMPKSKTQRFMASLIDNVPIQFLLVLRIMLTGLVVFVVMAVAFSAVPEANEKRY